VEITVPRLEGVVKTVRLLMGLHRLMPRAFACACQVE
jgi:hypothetical protein